MSMFLTIGVSILGLAAVFFGLKKMQQSRRIYHFHDEA